MSKSEKEKMLAGELYIALDEELGAMTLSAQELLHIFNSSVPSHVKEREDVIRKLFGSAGSNVLIKQPFFCDYGSNIYVGDNFFMNYDCVILDCNEVRIGNDVMMGPKVQIYTADHPRDFLLRRQQLEMAYPITIGDDVWIGGGAIICGGVEIGSGSIIGAGSVVTKSIPANVVAAGNPCRVIRELK